MIDTYITTTIPYVNAKPHIGFALELVQADAFARLHHLQGKRVKFQTGTDENAIKNVLAAEKLGRNWVGIELKQEYVDTITEKRLDKYKNYKLDEF